MVYFGGELTYFQSVVLFILALDIVGGIIANSTRSTNMWYWRKSPRMRVIFVLAHAVHPPVAVLVITPNAIGYGLIVYGVMLVMSLIVQSVSRYQKPAAFALYALALVIGLTLLTPPPTLAWFAPAYWAKLVLCLSVNQYDA